MLIDRLDELPQQVYEYYDRNNMLKDIKTCRYEPSIKIYYVHFRVTYEERSEKNLAESY